MFAFGSKYGYAKASVNQPGPNCASDFHHALYLSLPSLLWAFISLHGHTPVPRCVSCCCHRLREPLTKSAIYWQRSYYEMRSFNRPLLSSAWLMQPTNLTSLSKFSPSASLANCDRGWNYPSRGFSSYSAEECAIPTMAFLHSASPQKSLPPRS